MPTRLGKNWRPPLRALNWINQMKKCTIRRVAPDDLAACTTIEERSFSPEEAASPQSLKTRIHTYPDGFLVAEYAGEVIGQINSGSTDKTDITDEAFKQLIGHDPKGCNIVILSLSVLPEYRRHGVGSQLLTEFIEQARQLGKSRILLLCKSDLITYYARHGFLDSGISASTHGGAQWHEMQLSLSKATHLSHTKRGSLHGNG